jgi:hypothetical protein
MEIELVSKLGARLPRGGGLLEFGTTREQALRRLGRLRPPVDTGFVRGTAWTGRVLVGDRWIEASGGVDGLLGEIRIARASEAPGHEASAIPVRYRGIDVFDHSIAEVAFLLDAMDPGVERDLRLTGVSGYALSATLVDLSRPSGYRRAE